MWHKNFKIVSGGQTGADRAALDWARRRGVPHGGWCPAGRLAEDGAIDAAYQLAETPAGTYLQRTEWNVRDSCGTVIFSLSETLSGGSLATQKFAEAHAKPCLHLSSGAGEEAMAGRLVDFLRQHRIRVLNVAGPSATKEPGLGRVVLATLDRAYHLGQANPG